MAISTDTRISRRPGIEYRAIDDGAVLVDTSAGKVFELNQLGAEIWRLIERGATHDTICDALQSRYHVEHSVLAADVQELIDSLAASELIDASSD